MRTLIRRFVTISLATSGVITLSLSNAFAAKTAKGDLEAKVVYGDDNRKDLYDVQDAALRDLADSTVALVDVKSLGADNGGIREIKAKPYGPTNSLCTDEPFYNQSFAAFCSGFLVGPKTIVTAGHCINSAADCKKTSFVFGYAYKNPVDAPTSVASGEVYNCTKVIHSTVDGRGADFAVVEVDREVVGHKPLALRRSGQLTVGDGLVVIGHPSGLPTKVADDAKVRTEAKNGFFVANLDTYGGNSGSAVFNFQTKEVEGVLVRGEQDFVWTNGCIKSKICGADECRGEDVTAIENVLGHL